MLTNEPIRNHRSVIVKNILLTALVTVLVFIWFISDYPLATVGTIAIILGVTSIMYYLYWLKTLITITDEDVIIERNTVFKKKKTIPYSKIASINADRDIVDRIFNTTKLKININSSRNAMEPEAVLTFNSEFADRVRCELSERIFDQSFDKVEYDSIESVVVFTNKDVALHGLVSLSTYQTLVTIMLLAYSFITVFFTNSDLTGVAIALFLVFVMEVVPMFFSVIRYYDFKVFRNGDTIHLRHGAIQNYHSSFEIQRVNAVRVKRTFFARLLKKAYIEAEVVGIGGSGDDIRPMISILSKEENIDIIMREILPEFIYEREPMKQPSNAKMPMIINKSVMTVAVLAFLAVVWYFVSGFMDDNDITGMYYNIAMCLMLAIGVLTVVIAIVSIPMSMKRLEFDMGEDLFTIKRGIVDQETVTINYDKVQIVEIRSGIPAKKRGLAKCRVSVLSAMGGQKVSSGFFPEDELSKISDVMLRRVRERLEGQPETS